MNTYYEKMDSGQKQAMRRSIESELESEPELNETIDHVIHDEKDTSSELEEKSRHVRQISVGTSAFR